MDLGRKMSVWLGGIILAIGLFSFSEKKEKMTYVEVTTTYGVMTFKLYDETPLHRDNFLKLANDGFYNKLLFHRVIREFMIQGGDPDSKGAKEGAELGNGGPGYDIDAEFVPGLIHKRGVLAAAREGDPQNPLKRSSGSQFYIVQGRVLDSTQLMFVQNSKLEKYTKNELKACLNDSNHVEMLAAYKEALIKNDEVAGKVIIDSAMVLVEPNLEKYKYTAEQIEVYGTVGGTPHLDYEYTVFGEMVAGFDVLDSICLVDVDKRNRPMKDVVMKVKVVKK
ncbi:MAG: cyclophilin family peptidyl-prolyl cis-trans isomerase [Salibacteraceae bacterium]|jgi:cyclophilin family peptidyl-prolyl cis-trans isomerase